MRARWETVRHGLAWGAAVPLTFLFYLALMVSATLPPRHALSE